MCFEIERDSDYDDDDDEYGYGYDYGNYEDYDSPPDHCDYKNTIHDTGSSSCSHVDFPSLPPIKDVNEFKNRKITECCSGHKYLFYDNCEVIIMIVLNHNVNLAYFYTP